LPTPSTSLISASVAGMVPRQAGRRHALFRAELGTSPGRRLRVQAAVARAAAAANTDTCPRTGTRCVHVGRFASTHASFTQVARCEVVRAVHHHVVARHQIEGVRRPQTDGVGFHLHARLSAVSLSRAESIWPVRRRWWRGAPAAAGCSPSTTSKSTRPSRPMPAAPDRVRRRAEPAPTSSTLAP